MVEEVEGLKFTYAKEIAPYVKGKVIDYHSGLIRKGFSVTPADPGTQCGDCSC
ncbi:MAG: hypothetical protein GX890_07525 [Firmicutes bacterium]|jgi:Fe-S cluster assembly iron-binding protein IscA|nr:hypothetical protein [Bacillota bacterium]HPU01695.1 hypothetical protein [Bacillota bacterium]